jgi:hypothetical protein
VTVETPDPTQIKRAPWHSFTSLLGALLRGGRPEDKKVQKGAVTLTASGLVIYAGIEIWGLLKIVLVREVEKTSFTFGDFTQWILVGLLVLLVTAVLTLVRGSDLNDIRKEQIDQQRFISKAIEDLGGRLEAMLKKILLDHVDEWHIKKP